MTVNAHPEIPKSNSAPRGRVSTSNYTLTARPDVIQVGPNQFDRSYIATAFFEQMAGTEILLSARTDLVTGINIRYTPFSDIASIVESSSSRALIPLPESTEKIFSSFGINFQPYVPEVGTGPNGEYLYIDDATGDLVIEVDNIKGDEEVEVEILTVDTIYADTVYNDIGE